MKKRNVKKLYGVKSGSKSSKTATVINKMARTAEQELAETFKNFA